MNFQRAQRNLQLLNAGNSQNDAAGITDSLPGTIETGTQVPQAMFSSLMSDEEPDKTDHTPAKDELPKESSDGSIFMNTQIQSRLDDFEKESSLRVQLKEFRFFHEENSQDSVLAKNRSQAQSGAPTKKRKTKTQQQPPKKKSGPKNITQLNITNFRLSRTQTLLKQLSGKHKKVRDIIRAQPAGVIVTDNVVPKKVQYDTYNENEWQHILKMLQDKFPGSGQSDMKEVYRYLYGDEQEVNTQDLWLASQMPPVADVLEEENKTTKCETGSQTNYSNNVVDIVSLSQVMEDQSLMHDSKEFNGVPAGDINTVSDTTQEEDSTIIPLMSDDSTTTTTSSSSSDTASTQFFTPKALLQDQSVIDLTQGSFKVVNSLISPVKSNRSQCSAIQVPATRTSTVHSIRKSVLSKQHTSIKYKINKYEFEKIQSHLDHFTWHILNDVDEDHASDSEDDANDQWIVELELKSIQPVYSVHEMLLSQSASQLRESLRSIGLKSLRSKSQMVSSLLEASQVLSASMTEAQREDIYKHLTSLVKKSPMLWEKIYCLQAITMEELLCQLIAVNPFVDSIDEATIREWCDMEGISLKRSGAD